MATASGDASGARRPVAPYVAYAVVLAFIAAAGIGFWAGQDKRPPPAPTAGNLAAAPAATAAPIEPPAPPPGQGLKLPPRPPVPRAAAPKPPAQVPASASVAGPAAVVSAPPSPSAAEAADPGPATPPRTRCTADTAPWPAERTEQGKAVQALLRDLGFYDGTVYGTVGPATRAAIRKFQAAAGRPETGEPDEGLFDLLRRKCAAP